MNLEDRIRDAMSAHEHEAPTVAEFRLGRGATAPVPGTRARWLPAAAAACVVLAVAATVIAIRASGNDPHRTPAATAALACPQRYVADGNAAGIPGAWVPAAPRGVDGQSRMVPQQTPAHVVVCAYLRAVPTGPPKAVQSQPNLSGSKELGGELAGVARTLTWLPRQLPKQSAPCTDDLRRTDGDAYLVGLTYPTGTIWVSAPGNHCAGASNGEFATTVNLLPWVAASYGAGAWVSDPSSTHDPAQVGPCWGKTRGRLGQESSMVPAESTSVQICAVSYSTGKPAIRTVTTRAGLPKLVAALDASPPRVSNSACEGDGRQDVSYELIFSYAEGSAVFVRVDPHCAPGIDNGSLQAFGASKVVPLILQLLAGH